MPYLRPYRVAETTTTTGTGSITLAGAVTGYSSFAAELANADTATIVIEAIDAAGAPTGDYEICDTAFTSPSTLTRGTLRDSSTGSRINFAAGSKRVFAINPRDVIDLGSADLIGTLGVADGGTGATTTPTNGQLLIGNGTGYSVANLTAGTGISIGNSAGAITVTNSAPDQTVSLTGAGTTSITGTYPSFTITSNDAFTGTVTSVGGTGTVNGLTLTGTVTGSGNLTLGGTLSGVSLTTQVTGTLPVANGGTGATTLTANNVILGNGTSAVQFVAPGASGNVLTSNGTTWISAAAGASLLGQTDSATPFETSLGFEAGLNTTGVNNTFVGYQAGKANTTGTDNVAIGFGAADARTTGVSSIAIGSNALGSATTSSSNVAIGASALSSNTTAGDCIAIGTSSLLTSNGAGNVAIGINSAASSTSATGNVVIGTNTGISITTGSNNTILGNSAAQSVTTGANNTVVGNGAAPASSTTNNTITLGNSSITTLRCQVTTITSLSDARDKRDIADLDAGLSFLNALRPVRFTWDMRDGGKVGEADTGFIAQDLQAAMASTGIELPGLVYDVNPDKLEAGYGKLLPVLVKAIQELSAKVDAFEAQLHGE